jgi:hypothetical protein
VVAGRSGRAVQSSFPGIFLLLPGFLELATSSEFLRYAIALKCIGRTRAADAINDPAVLLIAGQSEPPTFCAEDSEFCLSEPPGFPALDYFSLDGIVDAFHDNRELDARWSEIAHGVMRRFARSLIGFHGSSPEHLYENFLEGPGVIRFCEEAIVIELPRSPLQMVLHLSGATEQSYHVPWLQREVRLVMQSD